MTKKTRERECVRVCKWEREREREEKLSLKWILWRKLQMCNLLYGGGLNWNLNLWSWCKLFDNNSAAFSRKKLKCSFSNYDNKIRAKISSLDMVTNDTLSLLLPPYENNNKIALIKAHSRAINSTEKSLGFWSISISSFFTRKLFMRHYSNL